MANVLVATDADRVFDEIDAALGGEHELFRVRLGAEVRAASHSVQPALVILDLQIGNMGGIAACLDIRLEQNAERMDDFAVLLLLDRAADTFLAGEADADGWLIKPLNSIHIRKAATALVDGGDYFEGVPGPAESGGSEDEPAADPAPVD